MIYLLGDFSGKILNFLEKINLDVSISIIIINILATIFLALYSLYELRRMDNESVMEVKSEWS